MASCSVVAIVVTAAVVVGVVVVAAGVVILVEGGVVSGPGDGVEVSDGVDAEVQGSWLGLPSVFMMMVVLVGLPKGRK